MSSFTKKPPVVALCDNVMEFEFTTDLIPGSDNIHVILTAKYSADNFTIGQDIIFPPAEGSAKINLAEYFRSRFYNGNSLALRQFTIEDDASEFKLRNLCFRYEIKASEGSGFDPIVYNDFFLLNRYVLRGKVPDWMWDTIYWQPGESFINWVVTNKSFLTFAPKERSTTPTQMQKLFFLVYYPPAEAIYLSLKVTCAFTDGSADNFITATQTEEIGGYRVYEFNTGYSALNLATWLTANHPTKTIYSYKVEVIDNNALIVSEARDYVVDYMGHLAERQFIYANNAGAYDTILLTGNGHLETEFNVERIDVRNESHLEQTTAMLKVSDADTVSVATGWLSSAEMLNYLGEFLGSTEVYELMPGNILKPVIWKNQRIVRKIDNETMFSAQVEYTYAKFQQIES